VLTILRVALISLATIPGVLAGQRQDVESRDFRDNIVLSVPASYVEICSLDQPLCNVLTRGYPPSAKTIGYFVTNEEWRRYRHDSIPGFTSYLIAQLSEGNSPTDISNIKAYVHSQAGNLPDYGSLPENLESHGRVNLGVFEETDSSISFGTVLRLEARESGSGHPIDLVATNSVVIVNGRVLSLYVYRRFRQENDIQATENLAKEWLGRLRGDRH
jgi:hypothetical protein